MYELHWRLHASAKVIEWYATGIKQRQVSARARFLSLHVIPGHIFVGIALCGLRKRSLDARTLLSAFCRILSLPLSSAFHPMPLEINSDRA